MLGLGLGIGLGLGLLTCSSSAAASPPALAFRRAAFCWLTVLAAAHTSTPAVIAPTSRISSIGSTARRPGGSRATTPTIHGGGWKSRFESAVSTLVPLGRYEAAAAAAACAASRPWPCSRRWPWPAPAAIGDSAEWSNVSVADARGLLARDGHG